MAETATVTGLNVIIFSAEQDEISLSNTDLSFFSAAKDATEMVSTVLIRMVL